jgi:hypothetical protein
MEPSGSGKKADENALNGFGHRRRAEAIGGQQRE